LPGRDSALSQSLVESRKLSREGVAAMERGQKQQAEELLSQAVKACPSDPEARRNYAETLWIHGSQAKAIAQMEEVERGGGEDAVFYARLAEMYLTVGQVEAAGRAARHALDLDPKLASAWAVRGGIVRASGQNRQALADYLRALGYAPGDNKILLEIAELYRQLDQPERALQTLQVLADSYAPGEEPQEVLYLTGLAYSALGRHDAAAVSFSTALMRDNPNPEILYRLGEAELNAGRPDEAYAVAQQALELDPKHQSSRELIGRIETARRADDHGKTLR
jgi:tetratricopeptide (TPR) repeat protein